MAAWAKLWLSGGLVCAAIASAAGSAQAASETVVFAGNCASGQNASTRTTLKRYSVVGPRSAKRVMACTPNGPEGSGACRPVEVYRFDILCNGQRRKWATVARYLVHQVQPSHMNRDLANNQRDEYQLPTLSADGLPLRLRPPVGYAPLDEIGARLEPAVLTPPSRSHPLHTLVTTSPLPDITPAGFTPDDEQQSAFAPHTEPNADTATTVSAADPVISNGFVFNFAALLAIIATALGVARRYPEQARTLGQRVTAKLGWCALQVKRLQATQQPRVARQLSRLQWRLSRLRQAGQSRDIHTVNAVASVGALLTDTELRLKQLRAAGPLTDVLRQELAQLRQRLETLTAAAAESEEHAARAAPSFRNLLRDVERVRRIADSAAMSLGGTRNPTRVPQTKSEAYAALGLNPDVAEPTLKKVADGLRMSWHPDLARDDADRNEREDRIKAINIALDLINEKRVVA
jgi:hypothetical protein